jgi:hypothetical protein
LIERRADRFSRLGERAYMHATRRQAAAERQSPCLSPAEHAARCQQWQVAPGAQQQQLQALNIVQRAARGAKQGKAGKNASNMSEQRSGASGRKHRRPSGANRNRAAKRTCQRAALCAIAALAGA